LRCGHLRPLKYKRAATASSVNNAINSLTESADNGTSGSAQSGSLNLHPVVMAFRAQPEA
jgi:hypothetical protein